MTRRHQPTPETIQQAQMMSGVGVPQEDIAILLGISLPTLHKHYREALDLGMAKANAEIGQSLFKMARKGNVTAAIYWTKARMGWREKQIVEVTGKDGQPFPVMVYIPANGRDPGS